MTSHPEQPSSSSAPKDKKQQRKSFTQFLSRAKTALKRGDGSKRKEGTSTTSAEAPKPAPPAAMTKAQEARARYEAMHGVTKLSKSELFEMRAKKLGERYGLEIKAGEWQQAAAPTNGDTVLRIDKPIRMRVRRTCHKCNAGFGAAKECPGCQHVRCTKCARYPPKRTEAEVIASRERRAALMKANKENQAIVPDYDCENHDDREFVLKRPSKKGGQDLIYKKPRQRVRRTCHECQALFTAHSKKCEKCSHIRCTDCPRDPPKKDKYPFGYPGDAFGPNSVPRYECERCHSLYPTDAENGTKCTECGREKTDESPRARPRKVEPEPDPEIMKRIEARMAALSVDRTAGEGKKKEEGVTT